MVNMYRAVSRAGFVWCKRGEVGAAWEERREGRKPHTYLST